MTEEAIEAELYIKEKYPDHDHCAQSARAVKAFLLGVSWVLARRTTKLSHAVHYDLQPKEQDSETR